MKKGVLAVLLAVLLIGCDVDEDVSAVQASAEAENGLEQSFIGNWRAAKPEGEGVIVNIPRTGCDDPVVITSKSIDTIEYTSPLGSPVEFDLFTFDGHVTWYPQAGPTSIAEAKGVDVFWLYATNGLGKADWENPMEYRRCKPNP